MATDSWILFIVGTSMYLWFGISLLLGFKTVPGPIKGFAFMGMTAVYLGFICLPIAMIEGG